MTIDHIISIMNPKESPYVDYIKRGIKHAEGRINSKKYSNLKIGDTICFQASNHSIICRIVFLHTYKTFEDMLIKEGPTKMLPQLKKMNLSFNEQIKKGVKIYHNFPNSQRVKKMGCLAIGVKFLK